jgi:hypothetical protein
VSGRIDEVVLSSPVILPHDSLIYLSFSTSSSTLTGWTEEQDTFYGFCGYSFTV